MNKKTMEPTLHAYIALNVITDIKFCSAYIINNSIPKHLDLAKRISTNIYNYILASKMECWAFWILQNLLQAIEITFSSVNTLAIKD